MSQMKIFIEKLKCFSLLSQLKSALQIMIKGAIVCVIRIFYDHRMLNKIESVNASPLTLN